MQREDLSTLRARIYLPEFELRDVPEHASASLRPDGMFRVLRGELEGSGLEI